MQVGSVCVLDEATCGASSLLVFNRIEPSKIRVGHWKEQIWLSCIEYFKNIIYQIRRYSDWIVYLLAGPTQGLAIEGKCVIKFYGGGKGPGHKLAEIKGKNPPSIPIKFRENEYDD